MTLDPAVLRPAAVVAGVLLLPVVWWGSAAGLTLLAEAWLRRRHGLAAPDSDAAGGRGAAAVAALPAAALLGLAMALSGAGGSGRAFGVSPPAGAFYVAWAGCAHAVIAGLLALSLRRLRPAVPRREVLAASFAAAGAWLLTCGAAAYGLFRLWAG